MTLEAFRNEPFLDFSSPAELELCRAAVEGVESRLGEEYPLYIGGEAVAGAEIYEVRDPASPQTVVGRVHMGSPEHARRAVEAARAALPGWARVSARERAALLLRAGDILRRRRREMLGWLAFEVGKNWQQSDGEIAEAIDHFEWNARQLLRWERGREIVPLASEINQYRYLPLGVGVVISPWNFPTTLPLGMAVAAIAAGNTVVLKPAEQAAVTAHQLRSLFTAAGLPPGVLNLVPGPGRTVGDALVGDPEVQFVAFVGSRAVGTRIHSRASGLAPGQRQLKRVMTEMGGKNASIVTPSADLPQAADEVVAAAFGYQGQKCSATSRLILLDEVHDRFEQLLLESLDRVTGDIGHPAQNHWYGPLITPAAVARVEQYIELARSTGRLLRQGARLGPGNFLTPTVVDGVETAAQIAQEEIFGPFLAVTRVRTLAEAVAAANSVEYALTGAVFSNDPRELDYVRENFLVGNLYLNRSSTGAMAGVHPFGGFKLSGTGPKVGSPDYLGFFLQAQAITQRVRYPLAP
jgi:1-pyrroline-5-carboxylate dehydrogenase